MTIPDRPLVISLDQQELTLDELILLNEPRNSSLAELREFLITHTNWTKEEVGHLQVKEFEQVGAALSEAVQREAVPLQTSPGSKTGRGRRKTGKAGQ